MQIAIPGAGSPVAFISSFYKEAEYEDYRRSPLWQLRENLFGLNEDSELLGDLSSPRERSLTWVAERSEPPLAKADRLAIVDRLIEVVRNSDLYVCILGDHGRNEYDSGSPVPVNDKPTAVSYFEIELYAAAMYDKPIHFYILDGFRPGPRLKALLEVLEFALPDWRDRGQQGVREITTAIRNLIRRHLVEPAGKRVPFRRRLIQEYYRFRSGPLVATPKSVLFLDAASERRRLPDKDRVLELIELYKSVPNFQQRLGRLWMAVRELMPASYLPADVQACSSLREFLPLWDCVLGDWAYAASWHGWHGHMFAGTVAPLNSQSLIRSQSTLTHGRLRADRELSPDGALSSAYYSIARLLGLGAERWRCMLRAAKHVERAIDEQGSPTPGLLAMRGSINLALGNIFRAVEDFKEMLCLRESAGTSEREIADAQMQLGFAYSLCMLPRGRALLRASVHTLRKSPDDPNLARALRKLAFSYKLVGNFRRARKYQAEANSVAAGLAEYDQMNR